MTNPTNTQINQANGGVAMNATEPQHGTRPAKERAVEWVGWHLLELVGVAAPAVLAGTVSGWFGLVSAAVGGGWAAHELRSARHQRDIRANYNRPEITTGQGETTETNDERDDDQGERRMEVGR